MKKFKISLFCGMTFLLITAFPGKTIQADPLSAADQSLSLVNKKHPVPFMGRVNAVISNMTGAIPILHVTVDGSG
ncbi:MAG: hypothetical protein ACWGNV_09345, partial [Bacteroidales bacterium]